MEYLNPLLLGGLAAVSIPIIIYLFNRSRYKVHKWGAMFLLEEAMTTNRKKIKIEQLILLALRCCIPIFLALCMARPVITGMKNLVKNAKSSAVILVDNSYSMEGGSNVQNNFSKATKETAGIIDNLPRGSQVALLGMAGPISNRESSGYDLQESKQIIKTAQGGFGVATVDNGLETAAGLFSTQMHHADRQLIIVSDFQKSTWAKGAATRQRAYELISSASVKPRVILMNVGSEAQDNVAVIDLELSHDVVGVGQPIKILATLKNFGKNPFSNLRVYFRADGEGKDISEISLAPGETSQVLFNHKFAEAGSHIIEVSTDADTLKGDNTFSMSIPVLEELPVVLLDGAPSTQPLKGEADFLNFALQPFKASGTELKDMISTVKIDSSRFETSVLNSSRVLILANVNKLSSKQLKEVEDFVNNGGGLLIFPGDKIDYNWYNNQLLKNGRGLLPLKLGKISSKDKEDDSATIISQHYDHPALEIFNDPRNGSLTGSQVRLWYELLKPDGASAKQASVNSIAQLDNGDPFLVEKKFGNGRVMLCSVPCDADWSNLPLRPFYLPLMQQLVGYLASSVYPPRNLNISEPITAFLSKDNAGKSCELVDPQGQKHTLSCDARGNKAVVEYKETQMPGVYLLETPDGKTIHYVVTTSRDESDLTPLNQEEIQDLAREMDAALVTNFEQYRDTDRSRRYGQEIWVLLLWIVLIAAFGELFLIQFFTERKA